MLLYADCANIETLKKMDELGVLSGITTNPAILARESVPPVRTIANICRAFPGYPVFAQANAMDCGGMVEMAVSYAAISPRSSRSRPAWRGSGRFTKSAPKNCLTTRSASPP